MSKEQEETSIRPLCDWSAETMVAPRPELPAEVRVGVLVGQVAVDMPLDTYQASAGAFVRPGYEGDPAKGTVRPKENSLWRAGNFLTQLALRYFRTLAGESPKPSNEAESELPPERLDFIEHLLLDWHHVSTGWDKENSGVSWMHFSHRILEGVHMLYSLHERKACLMLPARDTCAKRSAGQAALVERIQTTFPEYVKEVSVYVA